MSLARDISDAQGASHPSTGARRLWLAVLELALLDATHETALGEFARRYLASDDESYLGAFCSICDELDLQPSTVRAYAAARVGRTPQPGEYRAIALAGRTPSRRRTLSAIITRLCVTCGARFATPWRQQHACSRPCARRATAVARRKIARSSN